MSQQNETCFEERGIIKRIYVENFVTYDKAVIRPGRNLNVIIGPNGTGKSTIVCAIAIGLGGKPKLIGRATNISDYIKTDCHNAKIEIELKDTNNKNIIIVRSFNKNNQTTWTLNGKSVQGKEILELTSSLNIQVDNLCQFLPQDKVQDFSKMNSQQLLENTERSVGDSKLLEYHEKLMEYRKHGKVIEETIASKTRLLESETQKYEGMKETVGNIKERKIIKKRIKTMKQKKAWISYDISRKILSDAKVERDAAAAEMKTLDEQLKPLQKIIDQLENHIKGLKKTVEKHNSELCMRTSKVKRTLDEVPNKDREIRDIEKNREHRIQTEENRDQEINAELQQKNRLENDLKVMIEDVGTEEKLRATQQEITKKLEIKRCELEKLTDKVNASKAQEDFLSDQIRGINYEINSAKDVETKRLELLKSRNADAYRSVMWLRNNREKFSAPIYEPMLLNIHVKNAEYSKYLENMIAFRDLMAFVCEDKSDMNLLIQCLRDEEKLQMNVVYSDPNQPLRKEPNVPMDAIRQYGFQHYLVDLIEAPESILKYLIKMYNVHNIPLGTKLVENCIDNVPATFRLFFSESNIFSVTTSKYSGSKAVRSNAVVGNGTLSIIQDTAKLRGLTAKYYEKIS